MPPNPETTPERALAAQTPAAPAYMQTGASGTEEMGKHEAQPRLRIVQAMSDESLKDAAGEGGVVLRPDGIVLARKGDPLIVIPVLFFPTWEKWSDVKDDSQMMVLEQHFDPNNPVAKRAVDPTKREEPYGNGFKYAYVECLNFLVMIDSPDHVKGFIGVVTFAKGEHYAGAQLCTLLRRRGSGPTGVPIYGNRVQLNTSLRTRGTKKWYGFDLNNPAEGGPWTDKETFDRLAPEHLKLKELLAARKIVIERDDDRDDGFDPNAGADLPPI